MADIPLIPDDLRPRRWIARGAALIALQLAAAAAYFLRPGADSLGAGAGFALMAVVLFVAAWRLIQPKQPHPPTPAPVGREGESAALVLMGVVCLLVAVVWSAAIFPAPHIGLQFAVWIAGVGSITWGVSVKGAKPLVKQAARPAIVKPASRFLNNNPSTSGVEPAKAGLNSFAKGFASLAIVSILAIALIVRLYGLDTQIRGLIDETIYVNGILRLWDEPTIGLLSSLSSLAPTTAVYTVMHAGTTALFGYDLIGLRALNVALGVAGVLALYGVARELFDQRIALAAALILATFPPHLHFSRIAIPQLADSLFGTLAFWCAARGWRTGKAADWARAGICLGLTSYFYEGGRLLFPAVLFAWLIVSFHPRSWRAWRRDALTLLMAFALIAAPVYLTMAATGTSLTRRLNDVGLNADYWRGLFADGVTLDALTAAGTHLLEPLLVYVHRPDGTHEFYGGDQPMVSVILVPLLLLGVGVSAAHPRRAPILPALWALLGAFGNALLIVTDSHQRYIEVHPALALLIALGVCALIEIMIANRNPQNNRTPLPPLDVKRGRQMIVNVVIGVLISGVAVFQLTYYFSAHVPLFNAQFRAAKLYPDGIDAVLRAADALETGALPPNTQIVVLSSPVDNRLMLRRFLRFLTLTSPPDSLSIWNGGVAPAAGMRLHAFDAAALTDDQIAALPHENTAFFIARNLLFPDRLEIVARLGQFFNLQPPQLSPYDIPDDEMYLLYFAPTDDATP
ncbi:MAG: glycosyltransferase family 39 protein [Chloroflexota bacterium]|nr:glycosyltransferase family 39 protein [Chloroflexota bacterium]